MRHHHLNNANITKLLVVLIISLDFGCVAIPGKSYIQKQEVIGERFDVNNEPIAQIVRTIKLRHIFWISLAGIGDGPVYCCPEYFLTTSDKRIELKEIKGQFFNCNNDEISNPILPVAGTERWVAIKPYNIRFYYMGIELIIFDEKNIYLDLEIPNCRKGSRNFGRGYPDCSVDSQDGNSKFVILTKEGNLFLDAVTGKYFISPHKKDVKMPEEN